MNAAERYDWECEHVLGRTSQDLPWLVDVARRAGGPVLELACGTGRVTVPLGVQTRLPVVGLDVDRSMLEAARARGVRHLVQCDMRRFAFTPVFALVAVPYNSIQLLDGPGRAACLTAAAGALRPGGTLAVECTDFQAAVVNPSVAEEELGSHDGVVLYGSVAHDVTAGSSQYRRRFLAGGQAFEDTTTIWSVGAEDLRQLVESSGFSVEWVERDGASARCVATLRA